MKVGEPLSVEDLNDVVEEALAEPLPRLPPIVIPIWAQKLYGHEACRRAFGDTPCVFEGYVVTDQAVE